MSVLSSADQRVKRSSGVDAQDLEDSVGTDADNIQCILAHSSSMQQPVS